MNNYKIVVDAGHGGDDPGAVNGNIKEKDFNLQAANYMYNRFKELGIPVAITRDTDKTLSREERINTMKNTFGATPNVLVLSNHINSGGGEGAEIVYPLRSTDVLAKSILEEIGNQGQKMRKYYQRRLPENPSQDYYYIIRDTPNATTLLIEYGFIDNSNDLKKLQSNLLNYVEAVVKAVANYTGTPYSAPNGSGEDSYTVKKGDSLYSIAKRFNTTVPELIEINNLNSNVLQIGQILLLKPSNGSNIENSDTQNGTYVVKSGDSLWKIANMFNTTVQEIMNLNNLTTNLLQIGQELKIPGLVDEQPKPNNQNGIYIVKSGDTLYKIANQNNTTVQAIIDLNNLGTTVLQIGQELLIPNLQSSQTNYIEYVVKKGDSLWKIATMYNTTVDKIKTYNSLNSNLLQIGQILRIPK